MELAPIKSARRVVEIFEFFAERRQPATLMEVARALAAPPSSTSALLNSLCQLGYMGYDRHERTFVPTLRAALLGIWINDMFLSDGTILRLMHDLRERTGESVVLGTLSGLRVQYIQVMRTLVRRTAPQVASGRLRPLLRSAMGIVMLSTKDDQEVLALARRINAEESDPALRVKPEELLQRIAACRADGYGYTEGATTPGSGMVAMLLASPPHQPPMALGIGTVIPKLQKNKERYIAALRRVVDVHGRHMEAQSGVQNVYEGDDA